MKKTRQHLYTIPSDVPFLERLAEGILEISGGFSPDLARVMVLLPTRRACRTLRDTFLQLSKGTPVLLPRLQPLGDIDQDELDLRLAGLYGIDGLISVPPAMATTKRLFLLMGMIEKWKPGLSPDEALQLARSLAILLDQVHTEDLDYTQLENLVPPELSDHWQLTLKFLSIITEAWPEILKQEQEIDPADRRNRLIKLMAESWKDHPPETPVIAAGSTGSIPSVAGLLQVISLMPNGHVILPGLDLELEDAAWADLDDTHPQATMKVLLGRFGVDRKAVSLWGKGLIIPTHRRLLARTLMQPAGSVSLWTSLEQSKKAELQASLKDLNLIEAESQAEEALAIAIIMREVLETPGATATLITPDRTLARRVCASLRQWNVLVDDSAGTKLESTEAGQLALSLLNCAKENFSPLSVLNLLRNPLNYVLHDPALIQAFDRIACRGPRPRGGLNGLRNRLKSLESPRADLLSLTDRIDELLQPLMSLSSPCRMADFASTLAKTCEAFAEGGDYLWNRDDGECLFSLLQDFIEYSGYSAPVSLDAFTRLLSQMMAQASVRPGYGGHSRLTILGQIEARMISSDVMILGSLNEGIWPAEPRHDPWMSRLMRRDFGLPSPERSIGLSAHDFVQALCQKRVFLTRGLKSGGVQTVPSRWLQRLSTLRAAAGLNLTADKPYLEWAKALYRSEAAPAPASAPTPRPPIEARPQGLSATWVEKWLRNPYHVYTGKILKLAPLDPIDQDADMAERGSLVHAILREFIEQTKDRLPENAKELLSGIAQRRMEDQSLDSAVWQYWRPRLERSIDWFVSHEAEWRKLAMPYLLEARGAHEFKLADGSPFTLSATADRIDLLKSGGVAIIDYKTGTLPSGTNLKSGENGQLPLEGVLMRHGGYGRIYDVKLLSHWRVSGGSRAGMVKDTDPGDPDNDNDLVGAAEEGLLRIALQFRDPQTPYTAIAPSGRIYDEEKAVAHLARAAEWGNLDPEEGEV